jgi:transcriptional regulator with XRE-family HTH domain
VPLHLKSSPPLVRAGGLTQSELAKRLGLTVRGYQKLEVGGCPLKDPLSVQIDKLGAVSVYSVVSFDDVDGLIVGRKCPVRLLTPLRVLGIQITNIMS